MAQDPTYFDFFALPRQAPVRDECHQKSTTLRNYPVYQDAERTQIIRSFSPANLTALLGTTRLDKAFVDRVLTTKSPVIDENDKSAWQFEKQPSHFARVALSEMDYYPWLRWVVCDPAADAVNAVCKELKKQGATLPVDPDTYQSRTDTVTNISGQAKPDIIHQWFRDHESEHSEQIICTPHEFKRAKVLRTKGQSDETTLDYLVGQTHSSANGYTFKSTEGNATLPGKGSGLLSQVINEMFEADTGHSIMCSQEQYVLLYLSSDYQLQISSVYKTHGSDTQAQDMAELVLFYSHAAVKAGTRYSFLNRANAITVMPVTIPTFPTSIFQPYEGIFRGGMIGQTKLTPISSSKQHHLFFPLQWARFDGDVRSVSNNVSITHGLLGLSFLAARVVAKTAHGAHAAQRLAHEYNAYATMRAWQGTAIPRVIGLYTGQEENSTVLMMSNEGKALKNFNELEPWERRKLFRHLVSLHQSGIQHNDLEPRNVTKSKFSGPVIIDFDHASLHHTCPGVSCDELRQVAQALDLDPEVEIARIRDECKTQSSVYLRSSVYFALVILIVALVFALYTKSSKMYYVFSK